MQPCIDRPDRCRRAQRGPRQQQSPASSSCTTCSAACHRQTFQTRRLYTQLPLPQRIVPLSTHHRRPHGLHLLQTQPSMPYMVWLGPHHGRMFLMHKRHTHQSRQTSTRQQHRQHTPSSRRSRDLGSQQHMSGCTRLCLYTESMDHDRRHTDHSHCIECIRTSLPPRRSAQDIDRTVSCCRCPRPLDQQDIRCMHQWRRLIVPPTLCQQGTECTECSH